jgi:RHS repeat-associated protein
VGGTRSFDYTFNPRGSRTTIKPDGGTAQNYGYDAGQEVTSAPLNGGAQTFGYDNNGNRTSLNGGGVYASNNLNQYTTFNGLGATYDGNGNLKSYNGWTYSYDAQNRLKTVLQGTTTVATYWYDGLNRQITRNVNNVLTFHVWDGWNLIEERGTGNALQNVFLYGAGEIIENVTTKRFFFQDSLGNTSHLSDEAGNLLEYYTYSAFGQPKFYDVAGNPGSASTKETRHLFQGQLWTQRTGLNDYRNRVELPAMGVFLQPDPIGFKGDAANIYRFCGNNAVNRTDPLGLIVVDQRWSGLMYMQGGAQMSFAEILKAYRDYPAGMDGGGDGGVTVTGALTREAARAPTPQTPTSDSSKSMRITIAMDSKNPGQYLSKDERYYRLYYAQLRNAKGKAQVGWGNYVQEEIKVRVNQCTGCVGKEFDVRTTNGKPLYELPRSGLAEDRVGLGFQPSSRVSGTLIKDQRWWFQHGDEQKYLLPGVTRQTTTVTNGVSGNTIAPTSEPW